jgi:sulfur carrier protein ThiS
MTSVAEPLRDRDVAVLIDGKRVESPKQTTVGALLRAAGLDPARRELVKIEGRHQTPYADSATTLELHEDEQFITVSVGPTPVS